MAAQSVNNMRPSRHRRRIQQREKRKLVRQTIASILDAMDPLGVKPEVGTGKSKTRRSRRKRSTTTETVPSEAGNADDTATESNTLRRSPRKRGASEISGEAADPRPQAKRSRRRRSKRASAHVKPESDNAKVDEEAAAAQLTPSRELRSRQTTKKHSPYFSPPTSSSETKKKLRSTGKTAAASSPSKALSDNGHAESAEISSRHPISEHVYGLMQEIYAPDALRVIIVAIFCNQTPGSRARPFVERLFLKYPDAEALSQADQDELATEIKPLGLYNIRAKRLIQLATEWLERPPIPGQRTPRKGLPKKVGYPDTEISHLPGCGPYAMDSYRLFCTGEGWRSVRPDDKELRPYAAWRWAKEGVDYEQLLRDDPLAR